MRGLAFTFFFICTLMISVPVVAFAATAKLPLRLRKDNSFLQPKHFDNKALDHYKADKEFDYRTDKRPAGNYSAWTRFWNWILGIIGALTISILYGSPILEYLIIILSVGVLLYVLLKAAGIDVVKLLRGNVTKIVLAHTESLENIHEMNFDEQIEQAILQGNYRLAVRLLYLKSLKQLSDKGLILWQSEKTNAAYVYELQNPEQKQTFKVLTRQFEYVWYGNFDINKQVFTSIEMMFEGFKKLL